MPTLKRYQDQSGYYILARVNDAVVTFQTTGTAVAIFNDLGYHHGSTISWSLLRRLREAGHVYTNNSGVDIADTSVSDQLTTDEQATLGRHLSAPWFDDKFAHELSDALQSMGLIIQPINTYAEAVEFFDTEFDQTHVTSIVAFAAAPYEVTDMRLTDSRVEFAFTVTDDISLSCVDLRWNAESTWDFSGEVQYDASQPRIEFWIRDGYFGQWREHNGEESTATEDETSHEAAFRADFGHKSGLGFNPQSWTEVVRRLFVFVTQYDIRPDPKIGRGHRGLCNSEEFFGKDIWVDAHGTTASSSKKRGAVIVENEMVDLRIVNSSRALQQFVRITDDRTTSGLYHPAKAIEMETGVRP